jgi:Stf0 sulphotransferase
VEPVRSYVICCVQRPEAGSWRTPWPIPDTPAGRLTTSTTRSGRTTRESWGLPTCQLTPYVRAMWDRATTPNGVLGSKLTWNNFDSLRSSPRPPCGPGLLADDVPGRPVRLAAASGQSAAGHLVVASRRDRSVGPAARPGGQQPASDVEQMVQLVRFAERCEDGWRQWFASTGIQHYKVVYEDLARDRLAVANGVLEFLRLPQLDADDLPPVRYRKQADSLTERYVDLVHSAMSSPG